MRSISDVRRERRPSDSSLFKQVRAQFVGSDQGAGYAFIYVWLANQFGHFMIGFAGTILLGWLAAFIFPVLLTPDGALSLVPASVIGFLWLVIWIGKELLLDVAGALRDFRFARAQRNALRCHETEPSPERGWLPTRQDCSELWSVLLGYGRRLVRQPPTEAKEETCFLDDVMRDSGVDGWFYFSGCLLAVAMYAGPVLAEALAAPRIGPLLPIVTLAFLLWCSASISEHWLWEKIAFDKAALPFVSRFVLNGRPPEDEVRERALAFALAAGRRGHLVIIGPPKSGRTTTAVALGVEALLHSPQGEIVYTTLCKLLDKVAEERILPRDQQSAHASELRSPWPPEAAELLIVDDVGAQGAQAPLLCPQAFEKQLTSNKELCEKFKCKRVIWVVGDKPTESAKWQEALKAAFGSETWIEVIRLGDVIPWDVRLKLRRAA